MAGAIVRALFVAPLLALSAAPAAQTGRLPPIDSCARDPSFVAFRSQLRAAIGRRDAAFIRAILPANAFSDAGIDSGRNGFIRYWELDHPERSRLWLELAAALRLGCARDRSQLFWVPSMSLHEGDPDDATYDGMALAIVPGAALRAAPSDRARRVATLYWDVLSVPSHDPGHGRWIRAGIAGNREGYVRRDQIRSFTAYTAYFRKEGGRWRLMGFVTGQ